VVLNKKENIYFLLIFFLRFENLATEKNNLLVTGGNKCVVQQTDTPARDVVNNRK